MSTIQNYKCANKVNSVVQYVNCILTLKIQKRDWGGGGGIAFIKEAEFSLSSIYAMKAKSLMCLYTMLKYSPVVSNLGM